MYNTNFYKSLKKPKFIPQGNVFSFAWTILYALMFLSFFLVLNTKSELKPLGISLFFLQLLLNIFWSPLFFIYKKIKTAFYLSIILTVTVLFMLIVFLKISVVIGLLQVPYLLWLIFANVLNFVVVQMNPHVKN